MDCASVDGPISIQTHAVLIELTGILGKKRGHEVERGLGRKWVQEESGGRLRNDANTLYARTKFSKNE